MSKNKLAELEALLFYSGEPVSKKKIAGVLDLKEEFIDNLLEDYVEVLSNNEKSGLDILIKGDEVQLITKSNLSYMSEKIIKEELKEDLTPAILEVLTIIAYLGPISRPDIDFIRGVNSSYSLRNLILRGLIERERSGNTYHYRVTMDFLKHLGIKKIEDLPKFSEYGDVLDKYELQ